MTKSTIARRASLVQAIEAHGVAHKDLAGKQRSLANARGLLASAETKLEEARAECQSAKDEHTARVLNAASTSTDLKPSTRLRDARLREAEAQDERDSASDAVATMEQALVFGERYDGASYDPASIAHRALMDEVDNTIRNEVDLASALAEIDDLIAKVCDKRQAAVYLVSQGLIPAGKLNDWGGRLQAVNLPNIQLSGTAEHRRVYSTVSTDRPSPTTDAWKAARQALLSDAATPLPVEVAR